jgi:translation initiation factor IF-1
MNSSDNRNFTSNSKNKKKRDDNNNKEKLYTFTGKVLELLPDAKFRVQLDIDPSRIIIAYNSGKMRKNRIRIIVGDRVSVEMAPYDKMQGRVVLRLGGRNTPINTDEVASAGEAAN